MYKIIEFDANYEEKVKRLITEVFVEEFEFEMYREHFQKISIMEMFLLKGGNFWVAVDEYDNVVGTIGAKSLENNEIEVKNVYVKKDYRGCGISQEMYNILENYAIEKGTQSLVLGTYRKMERAIGFYYKNDFYEDFTRENEDGVVYMKKSLVPVVA